MARVKGSVLGKLSGKLGDISARVIKGRNIFCARPSSFRVNRSAVMQAIRNRFRVTANLVKALLTLPYLKQIWLKVKPENFSVYTYLFKLNFPFSSATGPTVQNIISPPEGFHLPVTALVLNEDSLTVELDPLTNVNSFAASEKNVEVNACICFNDPLDKAQLPYRVVPLRTTVENYIFSNTFEFNLPIPPAVKMIAAQYNGSVVFFSLATTGVDGELIQYSHTYAHS
jgi:hypothetical protein